MQLEGLIPQHPRCQVAERDFTELMNTFTRMSPGSHAAQRSSEVIAALQDALRSLGTDVDALASQNPADILWEAVSERVTLEVERTSGALVPGRVATEVERAMQARPNSWPATSGSPMQAMKETLHQLEA